jgi:ketosteroid isomerase-like protein
MFSWIGRRVLEHGIERLNEGDPSFLLRMDARDVHFVFPGDSSWSGEIHGKEDLERWLRRLIDAGIKHEIEQVVVQGPPWNQTVCLRGIDHIEGIYENRYVIWGRMRWGLLREYEVYEDTQKAAALDERLAATSAV